MGRAEQPLVFADDQDLNEVWPQVLSQYEEITKQRLDPNADFRALQNSIDQRLRDSASKSSANARNILNNVGTCLEKFGSILAQGASVVFGPSAQCWNAISFVITVAQGYGHILDGFVTLMERSLAFLQRLNLFLEQEVGRGGSYLPKSIRRPAFSILSHFLEILKSSYKLATSKKEKFKVMVDIVLFSGDAGVQESLALMESLVADFTHAQVDQILVDVKGLARYLRDSDEERHRHQSEILEHQEQIYQVTEQVLNVTQHVKVTLDGRITREQHKDDLAKIQRGLGFQKSEEPWGKRHDHVCKFRVKDSGKWIEREDLGFTQWADVRKHKTKVLTVNGGSGFGKTYASNYVISYLQDKYRTNNTPDRAYVAYYYYSSEDKEESLEKCLGSIIYQFAYADLGYAKAVAEVCGQPASIARAEDRWDRLVPKLQHAMKGTYYICIDGFDSRDQVGNAEATITAIAQYAMTEIKGVSIRFFVSGTDEALSKIPKDDKAVSNILLGPCKTIGNRMVRVGDNEGEEVVLAPLVNASDIEAVAKARIEDISKEKPDIKAIITDADIKKLVDGVQGHYEHLEAKMSQINACDTEQKVRDVITNAGDDLTTSLKKTLKTLNASLNADQIRQLNELLVWIVGVNGSASIELLQSALYFALNENFMLRSAVATTFSTLLTLDDYGGIKLLSEEFLPILSANEYNVSEPTLMNSPATGLSQAEVELCRRFVKNACGEYDYARFSFESFFNTLAGKQKTHVHVEDKNALDVKITLSCVKALCEQQENTNLEELRTYASIWFYEHLKCFVEKMDYFEADRRSLSDIGTNLVNLLYETEGIDGWFNDKHSIGCLKYDLAYKDEYIDPMLKLLKNPHVAMGYAQDAKKNDWVKSVIVETANKYSVMERVAVRLVSRWFGCTTSMDLDYFWFPYGIVAKLANREFDEDKPLSIAEIEGFIQWAKDRIDVDTSGPAWTFRVGATYSVTRHYKEALVKYKEAEPHLPNNWGLLMGMARTYENLKDYHSALEYIHKMKALRDQLIDTDNSYKEIYWEYVLLNEAECHRHCKEYDLAANCYRNILDQTVEAESYPGQVHTTAVSGLFTSWNEAKAYQSIIDLVKEWRDAKEEDRGISHWLGITVFHDDIHGCIITAAKELDVVQEVCGMYTQAIDRMPLSKGPADDKQETERINSIKGQLRYFQAAIMFHGSRSENDHDQGLQFWEEIIQTSENTGWSWLAYNTVNRFARCLLDKAAIGASEPESSKVSESYAKRLEALSRMNIQVIRDSRQGQKDPRLCLARLRLLEGNSELAHEEARGRLRSVFDDWPEDDNDDSLELRFQNLAQTLNVLDDDNNAIAAWQATKPRQTEQSVTEKEPASDTAQAATTGTTNSDSKPVPAEVGDSEETKEEAASVDAKPDAYIRGYYCDANCGTSWGDVLADCWACKHCLCVQLCSGCYEKLQADHLHPLICNKGHKLLYLPPFNQALWASTPPDMVVVGGQTIPRKQWLNQIRDDWGVQQEQIDSFKLETARRLKAASCIAFYMLRWHRKYKKAKAGESPKIPSLSRAWIIS
ncbi:hypothetical protein BKA66DRAFT_567805 [Pyrenochaeta sp. MPI-SDFR-AT-0127]|nr:hypothetical protein BKA66DRAFT_567805 [Pyrenochaeta sp. MPI-SDFR-AT-0127]